MPHRLNSLLTYQEEVRNFNRREMLIYGLLARSLRPMTDREVKDTLFGVMADMNMVRPRITDLRKKGWLREQKKAVIDPVTKKYVRTVEAVTAEERAGIGTPEQPFLALG